MALEASSCALGGKPRILLSAHLGSAMTARKIVGGPLDFVLRIFRSWVNLFPVQGRGRVRVKGE